MTDKKPLTYRDAGVDIDAGDALVDRIKPVAARTMRPGVMGSLGGFGGLFHLDPQKYKDPVLVSGTDGVGTKLKLAFDTGRHDTVGIDLVAMCVNDIIVQGAEPLFFLDYFATGKLEPNVAASVVEGIGRGCELAGAALLGGETAEMPGMYAPGEYDLAGFTVGAVERAALIDGTSLAAGDTLIGLASSGVHSNGFSLVRKIIDRAGVTLDDAPFGSQSLADALLEPTRIYVKPVLDLIASGGVHAIAHITGGGLPDNVRRVIPEGLVAHINQQSWTRPTLFKWLAEAGNVANDEMWRVLNCGVGMVIAVDPGSTDNALTRLEKNGVAAFVIGEITSSDAADQKDIRVVIE